MTTKCENSGLNAVPYEFRHFFLNKKTLKGLYYLKKEDHVFRRDKFSKCQAVEPCIHNVNDKFYVYYRRGDCFDEEYALMAEIVVKPKRGAKIRIPYITKSSGVYEEVLIPWHGTAWNNTLGAITLSDEEFRLNYLTKFEIQAFNENPIFPNAMDEYVDFISRLLGKCPEHNEKGHYFSWKLI